MKKIQTKIKTNEKSNLNFEKELHKMRLIEIETRKKAEIEVENLKFDHQLQLQRIKSSEIKRNLERRENKQFMENYYK